MTTKSKHPAIVIGTGVVSLGVINDLASEGVDVIHISNKTSDIALRSRWPVEKIVLDPGDDQAEQLVDLLLDPARNWDGACLIPTIDPMIRAVSKNITSFKRRFVTAIQDWRSLQHLVDKENLYRAAINVGVPAPRILSPDDFDCAPEWAQEVGYPVLVKPAETPDFFRIFRVKMLEARNESELTSHLANVTRNNLKVMVSEIIPGPALNLKSYRSYIATDGRVVAEMCTEKIRCRPINYGIGVVHRTIIMNPDLKRYGTKMLGALSFTGLSSMEFKLDARDNEFKLIEINPRPGHVQRLFSAAGINFTYLLYLDLTGGLLGDEYHYKPGVYGIDNLMDLYHLIEHMRRGIPGIREFLIPYFSPKAFMLPPLRDPKPFFFALEKMVSLKLRRMRQKS